MSTSINALFEALTSNMTPAEIKTSIVISDISSRIAIERCNLGMTQKKFAEYMGVTQGMVSKWESGDYNFTIESISNIFDKLNLDFNFNIISDIKLISIDESDEKIEFSPRNEELLYAG